MVRPIQEDLAIAVNVPLKQEEDAGGRWHDLPRVGRLPGNACRKAVGLGIVLGHAFPGELLSPGLRGQLIAGLERVGDIVDEVSDRRAPQAGTDPLCHRPCEAWERT